MIYLDPPFNSNHNYAAPIGSEAAGAEFKDTWTLDDIDVAWMEEMSRRYPGVSMTIEASQHTANKSTMSYLTYMAIRLMEMHRILKPTGSIYLHCDPTASHYLKIVMDAIFGKKYFRNEIIWTYNRFSRNSGNKFARMHDTILFYSKTDNNVFNPMYVERRLGGGMMTGYDVRHDRKKVLVYDWKKFQNAKHNLRIDGYEIRDCTRSKVKMGCTWEIPIINSQALERTGFPTQKPLKLLKRILEASSSPGSSVVLDPFCGCATTLVAAQDLGRDWIGIDISKKAVDLIKHRFKEELENLTPEIIEREDIPTRTGVKPSNGIRSILYGLQDGNCNLCGHHFSRKSDFDLDHITPKQHGGPDADDNLQLLCGNCNSRKGVRSMATIVAIYKTEGNTLNSNPVFIRDLSNAQRKDLVAQTSN